MLNRYPYVTVVVVVALGIVFKISVSVEDQTKYEFIMYDDTEYVILSTKDECNLIVPFEIDKNGQYIFDTSKYMLKKTYDGIYQYKDIQTPPHIRELLKES